MFNNIKEINSKLTKTIIDDHTLRTQNRKITLTEYNNTLVLQYKSDLSKPDYYAQFALDGNGLFLSKLDDNGFASKMISF